MNLLKVNAFPNHLFTLPTFSQEEKCESKYDTKCETQYDTEYDEVCR